MWVARTGSQPWSIASPQRFVGALLLSVFREGGRFHPLEPTRTHSLDVFCRRRRWFALHPLLFVFFLNRRACFLSLLLLPVRLRPVKTEVPGLVWGEAYKLVPVAFGVKKLVLSCVVEDDKVREELREWRKGLLCSSRALDVEGTWRESQAQRDFEMARMGSHQKGC